MFTALSSIEALREVIGTFPALIFAFDSAGVFTLSEGGALAVLGRVPGEAIGRNIAEYHPERPDIMVVSRARRHPHVEAGEPGALSVHGGTARCGDECDGRHRPRAPRRELPR